MTAALSLAEQGYDVDLVEKSGELGGNLALVNSTLENESLDKFKTELIEKVNTHRNIDCYLNTEITNVGGHIGEFKIKMLKENKAKN